MTLKTFSLAVGAAWLMVGAAFPVLAQDAKTECVKTPSQEITDLRAPRFGNEPSSWDMLYAHDGMDSFSDLVSLDPQNFVAAGSYTKDKLDGVYHPLIVKYNELMKPVWEVREQTKENRTIYRILKTKKGFTVFGDISDKDGRQGVYIASYTDDGKVLGKPAPIYESGGGLDAAAFIPAQDGGGYIALVQFTQSKDEKSQRGIVYKISNDGKIIWKRSYEPGGANRLNTILATQDGHYLAAGQLVLDGQKGAGWLLKLSQNGALIWQKTYPRGLSMAISSLGQAKDGSIFMGGKVRPFDYDGKTLSGLVMKTDDTGTPIWQRYFRGDFSYDASDMIVYEDGRASVLMTAAGFDPDHRSHARILTFTPKGDLKKLEDFTDGQNAQAHRMVSGMGGERIITGYAQTSFGEKQEGNSAAEAPDYTYDGWILAAPPLDLFEDPCNSAPSVSPLLP